MRPFQLDEGFNDKRLAQNCSSTGECEVRRFPRELRNKGKKDWEIFPALLAGDAPLVAIDFTIAYDQRNRLAMPSRVSGIIVVRPSQGYPGYGSKQAIRILAAFKQKFPAWAETDWTNTYVEITDIDVFVAHDVKNADAGGVSISLDEPNFVALLQAAIATAQGNLTRRIGD